MVVAVREDGYIIRGDNCYSDEWVTDGQILGVLTEFFRGKRSDFFCVGGG